MALAKFPSLIRGRCPAFLLLLAVPGGPLACKTVGGGASGVKVINGAALDDDADPAVVAVDTFDGQDHCTATFVGPQTLITAAHCVWRPPLKGRLSLRGAVAVNHWVHPKFQGLMKAGRVKEAASYDVALVLLPPGTAARFGIPPESFKGVAKTAPAADAPFRFVGYGLDGVNDQGGPLRKREGRNRITWLNANTVVFRGVAAGNGDGEEASLGLWDSGAPLLVDDRIIGIASQAYPETDGKRLNAANYSLGAGARSVFAMAVRCHQPACADDFPGSGVTSNP